MVPRELLNYQRELTRASAVVPDGVANNVRFRTATYRPLATY